MAKSTQTTMHEQLRLEMDKIEQARLVFETISGFEFEKMFQTCEDDDEDDDMNLYGMSKEDQKSDMMGVCDKGEMIDAKEIKLLALQIMRNSLRKLL